VLTQSTQPHPPRAEFATCAWSYRASRPAAGGRGGRVLAWGTLLSPELVFDISVRRL
jgi:hypothetical protein